MPWLRMRDYLTAKPTQVLHQMKDSAGGDSLLVHLEATHSGIVNGNYRFYRPDRMQDSCYTWTPKNEFPRPVLFGHNEDGDVLGRVLSAKYIDTSSEYSTDFPTIRDSLFYKSGKDKRIGLFEAVDWIVDNLMPLEDYKGLGYIDLGVKVTNPAAVQKVLRQEYLTVSVGFKTDSAVCSICRQDWAKDDKCEHKLGHVYDHKQMFIISGNFVYDEVSFVNFGADPFAGAVSKQKMADSLEKAIFFMGCSAQDRQSKYAGITLTDSLLEADINFEGDMAQTIVEVNNIDPVAFEAEIKGDALTQQRANELKEQLKAWTPEAEDAKTKKRSLQSTLVAKIKKNGWDKKEEPKPETDAAAAAPEVDELDAAIAPPAAQTDTQAAPAAAVDAPVAEVPPTAAVETPAEITVPELVGTDGKPKPILTAINNLDKEYYASDEKDRGLIRSTTGAMVEKWSADGWLSYLKSNLEEKDMVTIAKSELEDKENALNAAVEEKDELVKQVQGLKDRANQILGVYKRGLATQIVLHKIMTGADGYKDLTPEARDAKVTEFTNRHVQSLKDTVSDIMAEAKWTDSKPAAAAAAPAAREEKVTEPGLAVNDNAQVSEPAPNADAAPSAEAEAQTSPEDAARTRAYLMALPERDRRTYLLSLEYEAAKAKVKKD